MSAEPKLSDYQQKLRDRAYSIWEGDGRPDGKHVDHWQQAEQEIGSETPDAAPVPGAPAVSRQKPPKS